MTRHPDPDFDALKEVVQFAYWLLSGILPSSQENLNVVLQVTGAMLTEAAGDPPKGPETESGSVISALNPDLIQYASLGIGGKNATIWKAFGFSPEATKGWLDLSVPLPVSLKWKKVNPAHYVAWEALGVNETAAEDWESRGCTPEEVRHWGTDTDKWSATFQMLRGLGPAEHVAPLANEHNLSVSDVTEWAASTIPIEDAKKWVGKGYSVKKAEKLRSQGSQPEDVPDRKKGELFTTPSWKRISVAAKENGWSVSGPERIQAYAYADRVFVTFEKNKKTLYGIFGTGGQFRGAVTSPFARSNPRAYDPDRLRTVDEFIAALYK